MAVFMMGQVTIHDRTVYREYAERFMPVLEQYHGKLHVVDDDPTLIEGKWDGPRTVLVEFTSREAALAWYHSPEYQALVKIRTPAATANIVLVNAL